MGPKQANQNLLLHVVNFVLPEEAAEDKATPRNGYSYNKITEKLHGPGIAELPEASRALSHVRNTDQETSHSKSSSTEGEAKFPGNGVKCYQKTQELKP